MSTPLSGVSSRLPRPPRGGSWGAPWTAPERTPLTVVPRRRQRAPKVPFVVLVTALLVGGVTGLLLFNTHMQQGSFVAGSLEERAAVLAGKEESLRMRLQRLRDPQHLAAEAKRLGMVPVSSPAFIRLDDGKVLGNPQVADPADALRIEPMPAAKPRSLEPRLVIVEADTDQDRSPASRVDDGGSRRTEPSEARSARRSTGRTP